MTLFFKHLFLFLAVWIVTAFLNAIGLSVYCMYTEAASNLPGIVGTWFYSIAAGFIPNVIIGLTCLTTEGLGTKGIPLFRFILRAVIITWSVWMLLLMRLFDYFYESTAWIFFSIGITCAVISIFFFRKLITRHE